MLKCNCCNITSFQTKQAYTRHIQSKKHKMRESGQLQNMYQCDACKKWYCGKSGLYHHEKVCPNITTINNDQNETIKRLQHENTILGGKIDELEKKVNDKDKLIESLREIMKTRRTCKMKEKIVVLEKQISEKDKTIETLRETIKLRRPYKTCRKKVNQTIRDRIIQNQKNMCNDCNNTLSKFCQIDHITAIQYGGTDEFENLQALCGDCHSKKSFYENAARQKIRTFILDTIQKDHNSTL